jgi:four helix bundle protein
MELTGGYSKSKLQDPKEKSQTNPKLQALKVQTDNPAVKPVKRYDLEDRTLRFSKDVIQFVNELPKTIANIELCKQLVRSAGSIGANYIEANEALGKKDFVMRTRIARKEAKETRYWLELVECSEAQAQTQQELVQEATELLKILNAIISKSQ